jgi:hypothetical protein
MPSTVSWVLSLVMQTWLGRYHATLMVRTTNTMATTSSTSATISMSFLLVPSSGLC